MVFHGFRIIVCDCSERNLGSTESRYGFVIRNQYYSVELFTSYYEAEHKAVLIIATEFSRLLVRLKLVLMNFLIPGWSQFRQKKLVSAGIIFLAAVALWLLYLGWVVHLFSGLYALWFEWGQARIPPSQTEVASYGILLQEPSSQQRLEAVYERHQTLIPKESYFKILLFVATVCEWPINPHMLNDKIVEHLGFDSLDVVEMVLEAEEAFQINILDEYAEKVFRIGDFIELIGQGKRNDRS